MLGCTERGQLMQVVSPPWRRKNMREALLDQVRALPVQDSGSQSGQTPGAPRRSTQRGQNSRPPRSPSQEHRAPCSSPPCPEEPSAEGSSGGHSGLGGGHPWPQNVAKALAVPRRHALFFRGCFGTGPGGGPGALCPWKPEGFMNKGWAAGAQRLAGWRLPCGGRAGGGGRGWSVALIDAPRGWGGPGRL